MAFWCEWRGLSGTCRAAAIIRRQLEGFQQSDSLAPALDAAAVTRAVVECAQLQIPALIDDDLESVTLATAILVTVLMRHGLSLTTRTICAATLSRVLLEAHRDGVERSEAEKALLLSACRLLARFNEMQIGMPGSCPNAKLTAQQPATVAFKNFHDHAC